MTYQANEIKKRLQSIVWLLSELDANEKSCCGVTLAQCHALVEIGKAGSLSLNDLAEQMDLDKSTLSRTVNGLVAQGCCEREEHPDDRRYVAIRLTEAGGVIYEKVRQGLDGYFEDIYSALPEDKRLQVLESVELLLEAITKTECCR